MNNFIKKILLWRFSQKLIAVYKNYLGDRLISIVLFGSRASGAAHGQSDYDILIVAEGLPQNLFERLKFMRTPITGNFQEKISLIAKTPDEIGNNFSSLYLDLGLDSFIIYDKIFFQKKKNKILEIIKQAGLIREKDGDIFRWRWQKQPIGIWEINWSGVHAE